MAARWLTSKTIDLCTFFNDFSSQPWWELRSSDTGLSINLRFRTKTQLAVGCRACELPNCLLRQFFLMIFESDLFGLSFEVWSWIWFEVADDIHLAAGWLVESLIEGRTVEVGGKRVQARLLWLGQFLINILLGCIKLNICCDAAK